MEALLRLSSGAFVIVGAASGRDWFLGAEMGDEGRFGS